MYTLRKTSTLFYSRFEKTWIYVCVYIATYETANVSTMYTRVTMQKSKTVKHVSPPRSPQFESFL